MLYFFLTDYELVDESLMDPESEDQKPPMMSFQEQGSQLVTTSHKTRVKGTCTGRKLPRTPEEYVELKKKTRTVETSQNVKNGMASGENKELEQWHIPPKVSPLPLDNISESSSSLPEAKENNEGASGCPPYIVVLHEGTDNDAKQQHDLPTTQSICLVTKSGNNKADYEKLNPDTMDGYQESATTGYEKLNKATMEPQTSSGEIGGANITMHLNQGTSQNAFPGTRDYGMNVEKFNPETMGNYHGSATTGYEKLNKATMEPQTCFSEFSGANITLHLDQKTSKCAFPGPGVYGMQVEMLNPETMGNYHGSATTGYEELNKATMEPQTSCPYLDGKSVTIDPEGTLQIACSVARSVNNMGDYQKLNPETMESCRGSATTGYEKLNKATMEPQTCSIDLDHKSVTMHLDERTTRSAYLVIRSDDNWDDYQKLNPETMDRYQGSATTGCEKLNKATMEPQTCHTEIGGIFMDLDGGILQSVSSVTRSDDIWSDYQKLNPETRDSYQVSATVGYEELNKATMGAQTCSTDLDGKSVFMHLDEGTLQGSSSLTITNDKACDYQKWDPDKVDSCQGSATACDKELNNAMMEPQGCYADLDDKSVPMHLDEGVPQSACSVTSPDDKWCDYQKKLNPVTMDICRVSSTIGCTKLNKATMEPQTSSIAFDGKSFSMHPKEGSSKSVCSVTRSDNNTCDYQKLKTETMESFQRSETSGGEKFNKIMKEPQHKSGDPDDKCI